ncbi:uncharacterized protein MICPUCDRAFT_41768 [Micromonas pusilla CCMP1545]|uniref:Predicted protein n=1 Tax=Micromonas pusilla (strain CCMP1545) TaxID=564608 RepID=C1N1K6_MICPC|nr:uncharacterized protein MICPUCDRAFT_41768 [Micromonas pusilla CCMP1545]EEH54204.1 predicted protein [Micromonas pusilla CCMP1545]|eukprot:XP_003061574.1 predicted protein [Micromonas pusilla CCMP1545]
MASLAIAVAVADVHRRRASAGAGPSSSRSTATKTTGASSPLVPIRPRSRGERRSLRTSSSSSSTSSTSSSSSSSSAVERDTRAWLDDIVVGLNLCPFARAAMPGTSVVVANARTLDALRAEIRAELDVLAAAPTAAAVTTLVVLPPDALDALDAKSFGAFMEGAVAVAEDESRALTARRCDAATRDALSDVDAADDLWEKTHPGDDIRRRNAAALRGMGEQTLRAMLRKCMTRG